MSRHVDHENREGGQGHAGRGPRSFESELLYDIDFADNAPHRPQPRGAAGVRSAQQHVQWVQPGACSATGNTSGSGSSASSAGATATGTATTSSSTANSNIKPPSSPAKATTPGQPVSDQFICKICFDGSLDAVIMPCAHMVACTACCKRLTECPACRGPIVSVIRTYLA